MKIIRQFLYMVQVHEIPTRVNPTPNDLLNKQRLLNTQYRYWISFIVIECGQVK